MGVLEGSIYFIIELMFDITIIGAGITGSLIAHKLSKFDLKVLVLEKENDVAEGATGPIRPWCTLVMIRNRVL